jgi:hypothetical protein
MFRPGQIIDLNSRGNRPRWIFRIFTISHCRQWFELLIIFNFSFLVYNCGLDIEDPTPLSAPRWVQKSLPEEWPERGIDAHESGGIYLEWVPTLEHDIIAYFIYRAVFHNVNDSLGDYVLLNLIEAENLDDLSYVDSQVQRGIQYSYKVKSVNTSNNMSDFSEPLFYTLLPGLDAELMTPDGLTAEVGENRTLRWGYSNALEMEYYCLTILTIDNELISRVVFLPNNYSGVLEFWRIPTNIVLVPGNLYQWRIDIGAKYINGRETCGSESPWATFIFPEM